MSLIPGLGTAACHRHGQKKKKKSSLQNWEVGNLILGLVFSNPQLTPYCPLALSRWSCNHQHLTHDSFTLYGPFFLVVATGLSSKTSQHTEITTFPKEIFFLSFFIRAAPAAYESSQTRGSIRAAAASLHHSHSNARSKPGLQPARSWQVHGNARSLTHRVRTGIEPASSWILVRFVSTEPRQELLSSVPGPPFHLLHLEGGLELTRGLGCTLGAPCLG